MFVLFKSIPHLCKQPMSFSFLYFLALSRYSRKKETVVVSHFGCD